MKKLTKEFITSLITVILAILAITLFISSGAKALFYIAVAVTIVFGFYNAWLISLTEADSGVVGTAPKRSARKGRR